MGQPARTINLKVNTHLHGKHFGLKFFIAKQLSKVIEKLLSHKIEITMEAQ